MIPSRVNRELEDILVQWMLTRPILLHLARERGKDHRVHETVVPSAVETMFRETAILTSLVAKGNGKKRKQSKS